MLINYLLLGLIHCEQLADPPDVEVDDAVGNSVGEIVGDPVIVCIYKQYKLDCYDNNGDPWNPGSWLGILDWSLLIRAKIELEITQIKTEINPDGTYDSVTDAWRENIIYNPDIPCNFTCYSENFQNCNVDCEEVVIEETTTQFSTTTTVATTTTTTTTTAITTTTARQPTALQETIKDITDFLKNNTEEIITGGITAGSVFVGIKYVIPQVIKWISNLSPPSLPKSEPKMQIDKSNFSYDDCKIGGNIETFSISNAPSQNFNIELQNAQGTVDISKIATRQNKQNLRISLDLVEIGSNPVIHLENEDCTIAPCGFDVQIVQIDSNSEESACQDPDVVGAFQQSLTASYLEKFLYDRVKLVFTARPASGNVTLDEAVRSVANACYSSIKNPKLISCKVLNANEFIEGSSPTSRSLFTHLDEEGYSRARRDVSPADKVFSIDITATFNESIAQEGENSIDIKKEIQANVTAAVEDDDNVLQDVTQFISPSDNLPAFIVQMVVLCASILIGVGGAISKIIGYRNKKAEIKRKREENPNKSTDNGSEELSVRDLAFSVFFDYLWPIIGIYPAIFVWFEYKDAEDLMYSPIPFIINLFLYFGVFKVIIFFIKVFLMDARWHERKWLENYPITVEVFIDYDIVSYLLCDGFELAVVYFYASRYMAPENQVSIANFWIPTFTFLMAFIPGIYSIFILIRNWIRKKHEMKLKKMKSKDKNASAIDDSISVTSDSSDIQRHDKKANRFKFVVAIVSEILGVVTLCLTLLLFLCSTAVTLCVSSNEIVSDPRENLFTNGTFVQKKNFFSEEKSAVGTPGICKLFEKKWFNQRESRFDEACLEHKLDSGMPTTVPHPFLNCSNPLEIIATIAIVVSMVLHIVILVIFVTVRYGQNMKRKRLRVYHQSKAGRQSRYQVKNSRAKTIGILEHKEISIHGTYSAKDLNIAIPANVAYQDTDEDFLTYNARNILS